MSVSQVAVLGTGRVTKPASPGRAANGTRTRLIAFALLALYGVLRWGTMLAATETGRLLELVALAVAIAALGGPAHDRRGAVKGVAIVAMVLAALAMLPASGFSLHLLVHLKLARLADAIGKGLSALPGVIVPYQGAVPTTSAVIVLGAGMLLLGAALTLASARRSVGVARLAGAALPMVVLAIVPSSLAAPKLAAVHGIILFALLAALLFSERVAGQRFAAAAGFVLIAALGAAVVTPAVEANRPWFDIKTLAGTLGPPVPGERFDWAQTYGPISWPRTGATVLDVTARFPTYWKAENLDVFDGEGWAAAPVAGAEPTASVRTANVARWTETLTVHIRHLSTTNVIAAGVASPPAVPNLPPVQLGASPGTYVSSVPLVPGDTYQVSVYAPEPTDQQLAGSGTRYPLSSLAGELQMSVPATASADPQAHQGLQSIQFEPYGSAAPVAGSAALTGAEAGALLNGSVYGPVMQLAQQLKAGTATPYAYVRAVLTYLSHGFTYSESPNAVRYPIVDFLLHSKLGYCQQFAGAMALLLRMGGVPARVAAGFSTGAYDTTHHQYVVTDFDAHAWVEAWFPGYGWVKFEATPPSDPALGGKASATVSSTKSFSNSQQATPRTRARNAGHHAATRSRPGAPRAGGVSALIVLLIVLVIALILVVLALARRRPPATPEALLAELERAFARCRRPLAGGITLAALERRFADNPDAAGYVRVIRQARFADGMELPSAEQRRAVRSRLARGVGPLGWVRALIALPPRGLH